MLRGRVRRPTVHQNSAKPDLLDDARTMHDLGYSGLEPLNKDPDGTRLLYRSSEK